jgi:hypothetical protein
LGRVEKPWGVYQILWGMRPFKAGLDAQTEQLGASPDYVLFFRDLALRRGFPEKPVRAVLARGAVPIISLELELWGPDGPGRDVLNRINAGDFDPFFRRFAEQALAALPEGRRAILRFGFEMNGDWFAWGAQPEAFVRAWRRAHGIIAPIAGERLEWLWCPNILWGDKTAEEDLYPYHPGKAYVDLIGVDGYNFGDHHSRWHRWQSFEEVFGRTLDALERYGQPILIAEVGCAEDPRKAGWLRAFFQHVRTDPRISGFIYFNFDKRREGEPNWRFDSDPQSLAVARRFLSSEPVATAAGPTW